MQGPAPGQGPNRGPFARPCLVELLFQGPCKALLQGHRCDSGAACWRFAPPFLLDLASCQPPSCSAPSQLLGGPDPGLALGLSHWVDLQGCKSKAGRKIADHSPTESSNLHFWCQPFLSQYFHIQNPCVFLINFWQKRKKGKVQACKLLLWQLQVWELQVQTFHLQVWQVQIFLQAWQVQISLQGWSCRCMPLVLVSCCIS